MSSSGYLITTTDNPFNPHTEFEDWVAYDRRLGHNTIELLAHVAVMSFDLSEAEENEAYEQAVNEIIEQDELGIYTTIEAP
jgi:hypothetical protein